MTKKNQPKVKQHIQNPEEYPQGTVIDEFWDGSKEIIHPDGSKEFIDAQGKSLTKTAITDVEKFIEDLQKDPKNRLLQEYARAYLKKVKYIEDDKTTAKDILDKIAELSGALEPALNKGAKVIALRVNFINVSGHPQISDLNNKSVNVEAKVIEQ